jgi:hypothetical protein
MGRFLKREVVEGVTPVSFRGLAKFIKKVDRALSGMSVLNGRVVWSAGDVPTIVFGYDGQETGGGGLPEPAEEYHVLSAVEVTDDSGTRLGWQSDWVRFNVPGGS